MYSLNIMTALALPPDRQTKKSMWDAQRSMRYNQDAQRQEGIVHVCVHYEKPGGKLLVCVLYTLVTSS